MAEPLLSHAIRGDACNCLARRPGITGRLYPGEWMPTWFEIAALLGWLLLFGLVLVVYIDLKSFLQDITATGAQTRLCVDDVQVSLNNCAGVHAAPGVVLAEPVQPACRRRLPQA